MPNVPPLRFPEFSGEWEKCQLQQIASISKGSGISKEQLSDAGEPCILYGELYTKYKSEVIDEVISKTNIDSTHLIRSLKNDVIIPSSGETAIDISTARCVPYDNILLGGDLSIIRLKEQDGRFFSYQLNGVRKPDIAKVAQGVSVVHLYGDSLSKLLVSYPTLKEQYKIADFLHKLDQRIATQIRVIEDLQTLKKAISTQLLYGGSLKDIISLAELGTLKNGYAFKSSTYCENGNYNIITIANVTGERYVSADCNRVLDQPCDIQEHQLLKENDILISLTGNVGRVSLNKGTCNLLNQRVGLFELRDNSLREYIFQVLSTPQFESAMKNKGQGAAQMNIGKYDIEEYHIPYSIDHNELLKISEILSLFDSKILMENKLLQLFTQQKTFLLQKMFI